MPISTPKEHLDSYKGDSEHFDHVLNHLFIPSITEAEFEPIPPKTKGSDVIQAEIIKHLSDTDLVLCDMSILNPNVFFEFGIRTALDKPVALVTDNKTDKKIPFDTSIINYHKYNSALDVWDIKKEIKLLEKHIRDAFKKSENRNSLWKYFGVAQTGIFKPGESTVEEKIDLLMQEISSLKKKFEPEFTTRLTTSPKIEFDPEFMSAVTTYPSGVAEDYYNMIMKEMSHNYQKQMQEIARYMEEYKNELMKGVEEWCSQAYKNASSSISDDE